MTGILVSRASLLDARVGGDEQTHREHQILHVPVPADQGAEGRPRCALLTGSRLGGSGCPPRGAARCLLRPLPVRRQRWLLQNVPKTRPRRTEAGAHRGRELMGWQPPRGRRTQVETQLSRFASPPPGLLPALCRPPIQRSPHRWPSVCAAAADGAGLREKGCHQVPSDWTSEASPRAPRHLAAGAARVGGRALRSRALLFQGGHEWWALV